MSFKDGFLFGLGLWVATIAVGTVWLILMSVVLVSLLNLVR